MMKLRLAPILMSVTVTSAVLFGGWFIYNSVAMKDPVIELAEQFDGVERIDVDVRRDSVAIRVALNRDADVREVVDALRRKADEVVRGKTLDIRIEDDSSEQLDEWWSKVLFEVAEAMETRKYGLIPQILEKHKDADMTIRTSIDDSYVYVQLTQGEHVKYVLLERVPPMLGAWSL